jgi:hypothetical protein
LIETTSPDVRVQRDAHLATAGEDVDRPVVVRHQIGAVGVRRPGQLVDLFPQRRDVLAGLLEREGQLLVLRDGLGKLALGLEQALLEGADAVRGLGQAPAQLDDLFLGNVHPLDQLGRTGLVARRPIPSPVSHSASPPVFVNTVGCREHRALSGPYTSNGRATARSYAEEIVLFTRVGGPGQRASAVD